MWARSVTRFATLYQLWNYGAPFNLEKSLGISTEAFVLYKGDFLTDGYHGKSPQKPPNLGNISVSFQPLYISKSKVKT